MGEGLAGLPVELDGLGRRLARAEGLQEGVDAVAWACEGKFSFYRVSLVLPGHGPDRCYVAAAWARVPEEQLDGFDFSLVGHPLRPVVAEDVVRVRDDPQGDHADTPLSRLYRGEKKAAEMAVPLALGGRRGMLVFASRERGAFGEGARCYAEAVGRFVSLWARPWAGPESPLALKEQYEALLEGALDGIAVLSEGHIRYANGSFREIFGVPEAEILGRKFEELLELPSRPAYREAVACLEHRPRVLPRTEVEARVTHGAVLHLDVGFQGVWFRGETSVLVQVHNATARAEREREARDLFERVDGLLHTLAHDIRGPLTTVIGFSELLVERLGDTPPDRVREMLGLVSRSGRILKDLVEGLLDYSALGHREAPFRRIALEPLLRSVETELEGPIGASCARLSYRSIPPEVFGRPMEVGRVFRNLIENALKYTVPGTPPRIAVSCTGDEGRFHVFQVEDNGVGIEAVDLEDVFQLFHRGVAGGAGVGLAIVDRIVRSHGGRVWAESTPGKGSCFGFTLPRASEVDL